VTVELIGAGAGSSLEHPSPAVSLLANFAFDLGFVAAALYFVRQSGAIRPADFGYRPTGWGIGIAAFLIAGAAYYLVTWGYSALFSLHGSDKLPSELGVHKSTAALIGSALFVCVLAPIAEEFFFRGFLFGVLRRMRVGLAGRDAGPLVAAIITGILFGLAHTGSAAVQYLVPLGFLGFVLCLIRWRTGSLYPCMALHSFNNCLALGVNELGWSAPAILGLTVAAMVVLAAITWPLSKVEGSHSLAG
jgi:membrane protease YdiL (CAAX protease family)